MLFAAGDLATAKAENSIAQQRTVGFMRSQGRSEEEIAAKVRELDSRAGVAAVGVLLEQGKPAVAEKYLTDHAGSMQADDLLRMQGAVKKSLVARDSLLQADEVYTKAVVPALQPTDMGRLESLVMQAESGGRRFGADGNLWMAWAGDYLSNLLGRKANTDRPQFGNSIGVGNAVPGGAFDNF
ncbi:MAG: hypothetical protein EOO27_33195, partial [Comamonadaceae bacterium]